MCTNGLDTVCVCVCSYYGLSVWFPDMIKHLQYEEYQSKVKVSSDTWYRSPGHLVVMV